MISVAGRPSADRRVLFRPDSRRLRSGFVPLLLLILTAGTSPVGGPPSGEVQDPPRVILFIADGTGIAHWTAGMLADPAMALWRFPVVGLVDTRNVEDRVTDSAASATAYATGVLTFNRSIGMGPDSVALETVMERAARRGMATGLVATSSIVHATPASFAAHVTDRGEYEEIAAQMAASPVNVLLGGGRAYFDPDLREDGENHLAPLGHDRRRVTSAAELESVASSNVTGLAGLFAESAMPAADARRSPTLAEMTTAALAVLDRDPDGFLLVVEASQIDWLAHDNQPFARVAAEVLDCDAAVKVALDYADRHPDALVILVADHETGGTSVLPDGDGWRLGYTSGGHTADLVPMFAAGAEAISFSGLRRVDEVGRIIAARVIPDGPAATD
ncbi:MAG: alkaline phosphatase [marine benthic group bacterium]|nr:alkaline phosphatase [Candidatus Carthagonibacter metallireducens]MCL7964093.1 alkaline phosphatase [Gemmatimonadota bacterium]MCL7967029.1 alkaline phosphatase [Gemmatimonadota bacterium]